MTAERLFDLAVQAQTDADAIPVLHDLMIELDWQRHPFVMPLCLGMELEPRRPYFQNRDHRVAWETQIAKGHEAANSAWEMYAGRHPSWARAVLAAILFGGWSSSMRLTRRGGTRSPWPLIRRHVATRYAMRWDPEYRVLVNDGAIDDDLREVSA